MVQMHHLHNMRFQHGLSSFRTPTKARRKRTPLEERRQDRYKDININSLLHITFSLHPHSPSTRAIIQACAVNPNQILRGDIRASDLIHRSRRTNKMDIADINIRADIWA